MASPDETLSGPSRRTAKGVIGLMLVAGVTVPAARKLTREGPEPTRTVEPSPFPKMVLIPGGEFTMGSPESEAGRYDDETQTSTRVAPFFFATTEVTQGQWTAVMSANPSYFQGARGGGENHPVERVSVWDALNYANALSEKAELEACYDLTGCSGDPSSGCGDEVECEGGYTCPEPALVPKPDCFGYRLPTEAEWERAARAGTRTALYTGGISLESEDDEDRAFEVGRIGWYAGNSEVTEGGYDCSRWKAKEFPFERCGTHPVGVKPASPWGLHDVIGNVWEWTHTRGARGLPTDRVVGRGCGWSLNARYCRAAFRGADRPGRRDAGLGFRLARSVPRSSNPRPSTPIAEVETPPAVPATSLRPALMTIPAGRFTMGSPPDEPGRDDDEAQLDVEVGAFLMGRTEVTQGQWAAVMGSNPSRFQGRAGGGPDHPVETVSVWEALQYLNRLSTRESRDSCYDLSDCTGKGEALECPKGALARRPSCAGYRLPTEAEWEYAARAGTSTPLYTGGITLRGTNHAPEVGLIAWYGGNSGVEAGGEDCPDWREKELPSERCGTHAVAGKPANAWGLHDVLGNVWEWTESRGSRGFGSEEVVFRGCGWSDYARFCRAAFLVADHPGRRDANLGFRTARSVPRPSNP